MFPSKGLIIRPGTYIGLGQKSQDSVGISAGALVIGVIYSLRAPSVGTTQIEYYQVRPKYGVVEYALRCELLQQIYSHVNEIYLCGQENGVSQRGSLRDAHGAQTR